MSNDYKQTRREYYTRIQQRQTIIFGSISAVMALLLVFSLLVWLGVIPAPIDRDFSSSGTSSSIVTPCIEEGTKPVEPGKITLNIYNSTSQTGLASDVGSQLGELGFQVSNTDNWSSQNLSESARIITGKDGIPAAYTLAQYFDDPIIQFDSDASGETISVVLGAKFEGLKTQEEVDAVLGTDGTLTSRENCQIIK